MTAIMTIHYHCDKCDSDDIRCANEHSDMFVEPKCCNCNGNLRIK